LPVGAYRRGLQGGGDGLNAALLLLVSTGFRSADGGMRPWVDTADDHLQRALEFCDRAIDHLKSGEAEFEEAVTLVEGIRNELTALVGSSDSGLVPD
jgi:hypothetical protein